MRISVIIPTYNRSSLLERALRSMEKQTCPPLETLVIDDGSTDTTRDTVRHRFPGVRVIRQEHAGVSCARNRGIRESAGEWLAFLDSDDEWLPNKLEHQIRAITRQPEYRICHTDETWIRNGRRVNPMQKHAKQGGRLFRACLPLCCISPSSVMIHRSVFDSAGVFDPDLPACEDYDLWLRICARYPVLFVSEQLVTKYGGHADQLSRQNWGMDRFRVLALEKILDAGVLGVEDRQAALDMLEVKIGIVLDGARKHGNTALATEYEQKQESLQNRIRQTSGQAA